MGTLAQEENGRTMDGGRWGNKHVNHRYWFHLKGYEQRWIVEFIFSAVKRKFWWGERLRARSARGLLAAVEALLPSASGPTTR